MRNYKITNFLCDETYGGVMTMSDLEDLNDGVQKYALKTLEKHYGVDRPYVQTELPLDEFFPRYMFIAWLDGDIFDDDRNVDEEGDEYHGHHLFVLGFTNSPRTCVDDIYKMGDENFNTKAHGFFY